MTGWPPFKYIKGGRILSKLFEIFIILKIWNLKYKAKLFKATECHHDSSMVKNLQYEIIKLEFFQI